MIDDEDQNRSDRGYKNAVEIKSCNGGLSKEREYVTSHEGADNAERNIQQDALSAFVNDFAANEACNEAENKPGKDRHMKHLIYMREIWGMLGERYESRVGDRNPRNKS